MKGWINLEKSFVPWVKDDFLRLTNLKPDGAAYRGRIYNYLQLFGGIGVTTLNGKGAPCNEEDNRGVCAKDPIFNRELVWNCQDGKEDKLGKFYRPFENYGDTKKQLEELDKTLCTDFKAPTQEDVPA